MIVEHVNTTILVIIKDTDILYIGIQSLKNYHGNAVFQHVMHNAVI